MNLQEIKRTLNTSSGEALREYLLNKLYELRSIENIKNIDGAESQALEVKAQKKAYKKLLEIYVDILTFSEDDKEKDARDSYKM